MSHSHEHKEQRPIHVLFLDDEENVLKSIARIFMNESYGVAIAKNSAEAMEILAKEKIKVVLSDQRMPDISGVEFLRRVKLQYPDMVRILFTAYVDHNAVEQAINTSGVFRFINKPWQPEELKSAVVGGMQHHDLIMENRRLFEEMRIKNEQLQIANCKLKMLYDVQKDFSSTLSHELRTPLASIKAAIDIVMSGSTGEASTEQKNFLGRAKNNVDRLNRLINDILDLAHLESGKTVIELKPVNINDLVRTVVEMQESVATNKGIYLKMDAASGMNSIPGDGDKIIQVVSNLVGNAIKFTNSGGVTVHTVIKPNSKMIEVRVVDTGSGIKPEDQMKLFQKFQQLGDAEQRYNGTGLGLAICKEIIRQHGGTIFMDPVPQGGSCFAFTLPMDERSAV